MTLPGAVGHPPAKTEVEAQNQIVQLLFQLLVAINKISSELGGINNKLQTISSRLQH
jgi:hypothetical protein